MAKQDRIKGITIEIGGDTSLLSKEIENVNRKLKSTQEQLQDVERLLKMDPGNTRLLEQQQRLLTQAIEDTSRKLEVLRTAETQVQEKFKQGKISQDQYDALTREVVYTETALKKLNKRVEENADALKKSGDAAENAGESIEKAGEKTQQTADTSFDLRDALYEIADAAGVSVPPALQSTIDMLSGVNTKGLMVTGTITGIAVALGSLALETAAEAKEIENMSQKMGMTTDQYQEWDYIMRQFGSSAADMQGDIAGLAEKAMDAANGGEDAAEMFEKLGINVLDSQKKLKSQSELFEEVVKKLQGVENGTERSAIATELLSTTGENLIPVLQLSTEELDKMKQSAHDLGYVLEEETVKEMSELDTQVSRVGDTLKNTGKKVAVALGPLLELLSFLIEGALLFFELLGGYDDEFERKLWDLNNRFRDFFKNVNGGSFWEALGMPSYASGTPYHSGGWAMVGEQGRELVRLPRGSAVYSNPVTERMLAGGGDTFYITVEARNVKELNDLVWMAQNARRDRRSR